MQGAEYALYQTGNMLGPSVIPGGVFTKVAKAFLGVGKTVKTAERLYTAAKVATEAGDLEKALTLATRAKFLTEDAEKVARAALTIGSAGGAGVFGLQQAQNTRDNALQRASELEAAGDLEGASAMREKAYGATPLITGTIEALGEYAGTKYLGKLLGLDKIERLAELGIKTPWLKTMAKSLGVEVGTEIGQQYGEALAEKESGIRPEADPLKEAMQVIAPTMGLTILTGGIAAGASKLARIRTPWGTVKEKSNLPLGQTGEATTDIANNAKRAEDKQQALRQTEEEAVTREPMYSPVEEIAPLDTGASAVKDIAEGNIEPPAEEPPIPAVVTPEPVPPPAPAGVALPVPQGAISDLDTPIVDLHNLYADKYAEIDAIKEEAQAQAEIKGLKDQLKGKRGEERKAIQEKIDELVSSYEVPRMELEQEWLSRSESFNNNVISILKERGITDEDTVNEILAETSEVVSNTRYLEGMDNWQSVTPRDIVEGIIAQRGLAEKPAPPALSPAEQTIAAEQAKLRATLEAGKTREQQLEETLVNSIDTAEAEKLLLDGKSIKQHIEDGITQGLNLKVIKNNIRELIVSHAASETDPNKKARYSRALEQLNKDIADIAKPETQAEKPAFVGLERRQIDKPTWEHVFNKSWDEMTEEERKFAYHHNPKTGLPNERAYREKLKEGGKKIAYSDIAGLKWANDNKGYDFGDKILRAMGDAFKEAGLEAYSTGGDEARILFNENVSDEDIKIALDKAQKILENKNIEYTDPDGAVYLYKGWRFDYGRPAGTEEEADRNLKESRTGLTEKGLRSPRGDVPGGVVELSPEGWDFQDLRQAHRERVLKKQSREDQLKTLYTYFTTRGYEGPQKLYTVDEEGNKVIAGRGKSDREKVLQELSETFGYSYGDIYEILRRAIAGEPLAKNNNHIAARQTFLNEFLKKTWDLYQDIKSLSPEKPLLTTPEQKEEKKKPQQGDLIGVPEGTLEHPLPSVETGETEVEKAAREAKERAEEEKAKKATGELFEEQKPEPVPHDEWRHNLIKARTYAKELGIADKVENWDTVDSIVKAIDKELASRSKPEIIPGVKPKTVRPDYSVVNLAGIIKTAIDSEMSIDRNSIYKYVADKLGISTKQMLKDEGFNKKALEEAFEYAVKKKANEIALSGMTKAEKWKAILELSDRQINLSTRTSGSIEKQQYSTPAPIAYLMGEWAGEGKMGDFESGSGMLTIAFNPKDVIVNDMDKELRKQILENSGFAKVFNEDAMELLKKHPELIKSLDVVLLNPPFGSAPVMDMEGFKISKLEHQLIIEGLKAMKDNGRAAVIIGGHNFAQTGTERPMTEADRVFLNYLYSRYNVTHNIDIDGQVYKKQGTTFPIRLITIEGRKAAPDKTFAPADKSQVESAKTFTDIKNILETKKKAQKLESTDAAIKRWWDKKKDRVNEASGDIEEQLKVIYNETNRTSLLEIPLGENPTTRLPLYIEKIRDNTLPFSEWAGEKLGGGRERWRDNHLTVISKMMQAKPEMVKALAVKYIETLGAIRNLLQGVTNITDAATLYSEMLKGEVPLGFEVDSKTIRDMSRRGYYYFTPDYNSSLIKHENEEYDKPKNASDRISTKLDEIKREKLPDYRNGKDVAGEDLKKTFGFASITYGNYADAKTRQLHTNHAFDALHDLAKRRGIKPEHISLNGSLHLTIGALGHGKYSAFFSPAYPHPDGRQVKVINLTRDRGDGSLAHEWLHALDDYLRGKGFNSQMNRVVNSLKYWFNKEKATERFKRFLKGDSYYSTSKNDHRGNALTWIGQQIRHESDAREVTKYYSEAMSLDKGRGSKKYWSNDEELFARAFESFMFDTLEGSSPYLVNEFASEGFAQPPLYKGKPYPFTDERASFNRQLGNFFNLIEWTDTGPQIKKDAEFDYDIAFKEYKQHIQYLKDNIDRYEARANKPEPKPEAKPAAPPEPKAEEALNALNAVKAALNNMSEQDIDALIDDAVAEEFPKTEAEAKADTPTRTPFGTEGQYPPKVWNDFLDSDEAKKIRAKYKGKGTQLAKIGERFRELYPEIYKVLTEKQSTIPIEDEPTLGGIAKDFKAAGIEGINEALDGLYKLFGGGTIKSFPAGLDREAYEAARPHFIKAFQATIRAGHSIADFAKLIVKTFGEKIRPYLKHFLTEVTEGKLDKELESGIIGTKEAEEDGRREQAGETGGGLSEGQQPSESGVLSGGRGDAESAIRPPEGTLPDSSNALLNNVIRGEGKPQGDRVAGTAGGRTFGEVLHTEEQQSHLNGDLQTPYKPHSKKEAGLNFVPKNIADAISKALDKVEERHGDIDSFVAKNLKFNNTQLFKAFSAEQIDALALIFDNFERGIATIVGDQTGTGKGRIAAAVIRYAILKGLKPIFFTANSKLFTDMHRDLLDIGHDYRPFIMHNNPESAILDDEGNIVFKPSVKQGILQKMVQYPQAVMKDYDAVFIPYSQIQKENKQQQIIRELAKDNIVILDESHFASGESARGDFIKGVLQDAKNVTYLSATFAKKPSSMPLYFRTSLGMAGIDIESLIDIMQKGGDPLQQILAIQLAGEGQLIRREMDFSGVSFRTHVDVANEARDTERADRVTEVLRAIIEFDDIKHSIIKKMDKEAKKQGETLTGKRHTGAGVQSANFSSLVHNIIGQVLVGLKADASVDFTLRALKEGKKPVLNLMNTMEAYMDYLADEGVKVGDAIDGSFNGVLKKALDGTLYYTITDPQGKKSDKIKIDVDEFRLRRAYDHVMELINKSQIDIPASPIDYIKNKIQQAGYSIGEITGRGYYIDYSTPTPTLQRRTAKEQKDRNTPVNDFNSGRVRVLIYNAAGSTGLSLHASETFNDKNVRHMVILQADLNIDTFMQALGRVFRKGQVVNPEYVLLQTALPAEIRLAAVLNMKMKKLNANTKADTDSATTLKDIPDMINMYGDDIAQQWLEEHPDDMHHMGLQAIPEDDAMRKVTGKVAILLVAKQKEFYEDVEERYKDLIEHLNQIGENRLIARDHDFMAETIEKTLIHKGDDESNPFSASAYLEKARVNVLKRPFNAENIKERVNARLKGKTADEINKELMEKIRQRADNYIKSLPDKYKDPDVIEERRNHAIQDIQRYSRQLGEFKIGWTYEVEIVEGYSTRGVLIDIRYQESDKGYPLSGSKLRFTFAVVDPIQTVSLSLMQEKQLYNSDLVERKIDKDWDSLLSKERKEERYIITGNLINGFDRLSSFEREKEEGSHRVQGEIITYTDKDGNHKQGILIPRTMHREVEDKFKNVSVGVDEVMAWLSKKPRYANFRTTNGEVNFQHDAYSQAFEVSVKRGRQTGGKYYLDQELLALVKNREFTSYGNEMRADVSMNNLQAFLSLLQTKFNQRFLIPREGDLSQGGTSLQITDKKLKVSHNQLAAMIEKAATILSPGSRIVTKDNIELTAAQIREGLERYGLSALDNMEIVSYMKSHVIKGAQKKIRTPLGRIASYIEVSLAHADETTIPHEVFHDVFQVLLNDNERRIVLRGYKTEEKAAQAFAGYWIEANGGRKAMGLSDAVRQAFRKIAEFFEKLRNYLHGLGYKSAGDIFGEAFRGEYRERTVDKGVKKAYKYRYEEDKTKAVYVSEDRGADIHARRPSGKILERPQVISEKVRTQRIPTVRVLHSDNAAAVASYLKNYPQEVLLSIIADKNGKVISLHEHSRGGISNSLFDTKLVAGQALNTPDAAMVWIAHNHPSQNVEASSDDMLIARRIADTLKDSGLEYKGSLVITPKDYSRIEDYSYTGKPIPDIPANKTGRPCGHERTVNKTIACACKHSCSCCRCRALIRNARSCTGRSTAAGTTPLTHQGT